MDRTINIDVTPEENETIMAERRRKAEEIEKKRAKRKEDTIKKGNCFMAALTVIKDMKATLELELNEMSAAENDSDNSRSSLKAGKSMNWLCTMMEIGMTAMADASGYAIFYDRWLHIDSGALFSSCKFSPRERFEWAERAVKSVRNLDLAVVKSFTHYQYIDFDTDLREEGSNKRKRS